MQIIQTSDSQIGELVFIIDMTFYIFISFIILSSLILSIMVDSLLRGDHRKYMECFDCYENFSGKQVEELRDYYKDVREFLKERLGRGSGWDGSQAS